VPAAACAAAVLAGCNARMASVADTAPEPTKTDASQQAVLRAIGGSAVSGKIRVIDRGDHASVLASLLNVPQGPYRIAIHETPNCSSPNGFSAGRPWAPASSSRTPQDLIPVQYGKTEQLVELELRIPGLHANGVDGVAGHSVVLYYGTSIPEIRPDVRNDAIACGVFEPTRLLTF
jgi:Cu/Zn superoxide dismutase